MLKYFAILIIVLLLSCSKENGAGKTNSNLRRSWDEIVKKHDKTVTEIPKAVDDRFFYVNGYRTALSMQRDSLNLSLDYFIQGFVDALKQAKPMIEVDSMETVVQDFSKFMTARMDSITKLKEIEFSVQLVQNLAEADSFLTENAKKPGVISLPSRLQYKILKEGTGNIPTVHDAVLVHMTSTFADGTVFDDTRGKEPRAIPNEKMIPGWLEAITKMKEGSRWVVYMHPTLGFGESGAEGRVPPNKLTIVDVELIKIMTPEEVTEHLKKHPPTPMPPPTPMGMQPPPVKR